MSGMNEWVADPTLEVFRVERFPDLALPRYLAKYQGGVRPAVVNTQRGFLALLWELAQIDGDNPTEFTLRYAYRQPLLHCYLIVKRKRAVTGLPPMREIVLNSPVTEFYSVNAGPDPDGSPAEHRRWRHEILTAIDESEWATESVVAAKQEALFSPLHAGVAGMPQKYYVTYPLEPSEDNDYTFLDALFFHMFHKVKEIDKAVIDLMIRPTRLTKGEGDSLRDWIIALEQVNSHRDEADRLAESRVQREEDLNAKAVMDVFEDYHSEYNTNALFEFCVRFTTERPSYAQVLAGSVMTATTEGTRFSLGDPLPCTPGHRDPRSLGEHPGGFPTDLMATKTDKVRKVWRFFESEGAKEGPQSRFAKTFLEMKRLPYLAQLDEIAPLFRMIIPGPNIPQTFDRESDVALDKEERSKAKLRMGTDFERPRRIVYVDRERLKKHLFVSGVPGSGKTTLVLNLLLRLWQQGIPFLVIEPAKTEYRTMTRFASAVGDESDMYRKIARDVQVFTIGRDQGCPFRFNPFEFPPGISLDQHLANLDACFRGALPLEPPMPALLSEAIDLVYRDKGWHGEDEGGCPRGLPSMEDLYVAIGELLKKKKYSAEIRDNISTALEVRIGGLLKRNIGQIFNTRTSVPRFAELMRSPVILEMDSLSEEQTNLMTMFVLMGLREYVQGAYQTGDPLHHILVLEEAHNIVGAVSDGDDEANPKVHATRFVSRMLAEVRALGQGLIIADQIPTAVAPEVIKNTGIKAINRIVSMDDRDTIGMAMLLDPLQNEDLARLNPGQGYIYMEGMPKPLKFIGDDPRKVKLSDGDQQFDVTTMPPPTESELVRILAKVDWFKNHMLALVDHAEKLLHDFHEELVPRYEDLDGRLEERRQAYGTCQDDSRKALESRDAKSVDRAINRTSGEIRKIAGLDADAEELLAWYLRRKDAITRYLKLLERVNALGSDIGGPAAPRSVHADNLRKLLDEDDGKVTALAKACSVLRTTIEDHKTAQQEEWSQLQASAPKPAPKPAAVPAPKPAPAPAKAQQAPKTQAASPEKPTTKRRLRGSDWIGPAKLLEVVENGVADGEGVAADLEAGNGMSFEFILKCAAAYKTGRLPRADAEKAMAQARTHLERVAAYAFHLDRKTRPWMEYHAGWVATSVVDRDAFEKAITELAERREALAARLEGIRRKTLFACTKFGEVLDRG